jgi:hypothetical protein
VRPDEDRGRRRNTGAENTGLHVLQLEGEAKEIIEGKD